MVFSYLTSLVYQWDVEADRSYQAAVFEDGHPYQVEFAAIPEFCRECQLAELFIKTMLSVDGQRVIALRNYMFPAAAGVGLTRTFDRLPSLPLISTPRNKDLQFWTNVFRN